MQLKLIKILKDMGIKIANSIAFWPALIAILFVILCFLMIWFDYSPLGKSLKEQLHWLSLKDAETARSILSAITAGMISMTVFSFSMVMIFLNQATSQLSNRVLDKLIENTFQQFVLGCYMGTIVYALFLLSTIRDIDKGVYVPALSTYMLIALTVFDIFLFIYFLHYITQTVKFRTIIKRIQKETFLSLKRPNGICNEPKAGTTLLNGIEMLAPSSGTFHGFDRKALLQIAQDENLSITFVVQPGDFMMEKTPLLLLHQVEGPSKEICKKINAVIHISDEELIGDNYFYGFRQLTEVAVKALSPGINDPSTAVASLKALAELLAFRMLNPPQTRIADKTRILRIVARMHSIDELFQTCVLPIWDYGKTDRLLQIGMKNSLTELTRYGNYASINDLIRSVNTEMVKGSIIG